MVIRLYARDTVDEEQIRKIVEAIIERKVNIRVSTQEAGIGTRC